MATYEYKILIGRDAAGGAGGVAGVGDLGYVVRTEIILMREGP